MREKEEIMRTAMMGDFPLEQFYFVYTTLSMFSPDFIRELKDHIYWHDDNKNYIKQRYGLRFYKELFGNE